MLANKLNYGDTIEYNFPIIKCNDFGHKIVNSVIPIGVDAKIDSDNEKWK